MGGEEAIKKGGKRGENDVTVTHPCGKFLATPLFVIDVPYNFRVFDVCVLCEPDRMTLCCMFQMTSGVWGRGTNCEFCSLIKLATG